MNHWRRTVWGRSSPRRRLVLASLMAVAVVGMVIGSTLWRPAGLVGAVALLAFSLVVVSTV